MHSLSKNRSGSSSSRVDANIVTYDADVGQVITEEEDHRNKSDDAITESDDDDDAGIFSIPNDYPAQITTPSMMNRKKRGIFLEFVQGKLNKITPSQQMNSAGSGGSGPFRARLHLIRGGPAEMTC